MGKFIEEFYYVNIDPQARSTKQNKAVQKQMEVLMLNVWGQRHLLIAKRNGITTRVQGCNHTSAGNLSTSASG